MQTALPRRTNSCVWKVRDTRGPISQLQTLLPAGNASTRNCARELKNYVKPQNQKAMIDFIMVAVLGALVGAFSVAILIAIAMRKRENQQSKSTTKSNH
jgi:hypothetical protein